MIGFEGCRIGGWGVVSGSAKMRVLVRVKVKVGVEVRGEDECLFWVREC